MKWKPSEAEIAFRISRECAPTTDAFGRVWKLPQYELCDECGQPDNCGDCNHEPYTADEARQLGAIEPVLEA